MDEKKLNEDFKYHIIILLLVPNTFLSMITMVNSLDFHRKGTVVIQKKNVCFKLQDEKQLCREFVDGKKRCIWNKGKSDIMLDCDYYDELIDELERQNESRLQ